MNTKYFLAILLSTIFCLQAQQSRADEPNNIIVAVLQPLYDFNNPNGPAPAWRSITLNAQGVINAVGGPLPATPVTKQISQAELSEINNLISQLNENGNNIVTEVRSVLCFMAPSPVLTHLLISNLDTGSQTSSLKLVLTDSECALPTYTHPAQESYLNVAVQLETNLGKLVGVSLGQ